MVRRRLNSGLMVTKGALILIVDDHAVIASAMAMALDANGLGPAVVVGSSDLSIEAVLATARSCEPEIVMLDLYLGQEQLSLPMIPLLRESGAMVVLFTSSTDPRLLSSGLRLGVEAIVDKATSFDEVLRTIEQLRANRFVMTAEERQETLDSLERGFSEDDARRRPFELLTRREAEVLQRLIVGDAPKQIAHSEGISVSTVRGHIERILHKLGVSNQREALALARAANWHGNSASPSQH